jgi:HAD superfamily phosphoserine phosphatase-like hydrolase
MEGALLELVSFDVDGTILRGRILNHLRIPKETHARIEALHDLFHQERLGYEETLRAQFSLLAGMRAHDIAPHAADLPLINDLHATIDKLNLKGVKTVILTDNPSFVVEPMRVYGFDGVVASKIEVQDGVLTDRMRILTNKLQVIREYCTEEGIETTRCAHIGDGFNDIVAFTGVGVSVAFNSHEDGVAEAATYSVRGNSLLDVYRVLEPHLPTRP